MRRIGALLFGLVLAAAGAEAADRRWENPIFSSEESAVAAAAEATRNLDADSPPALQLFVDCTLSASDPSGPPERRGIVREMVGDFLLTRPHSSDVVESQRRTIDRFRAAVPKQERVIVNRLERFGFPARNGLVWCRMVESVDAFAGLGPPSSDRMSQIAGVTYFCRTIMLPMSYVGTRGIENLRKRAAMDPTLDVENTLSLWRRESFANLINTFRHELVHVHTNSGLGVPTYSDRAHLPTWFHEGTATYLAGDPHAGLSRRYQQYQNLFFYLVQRFGVEKLASFYEAIFTGESAAAALAQVYDIGAPQELYDRAGRWHRLGSAVRLASWIAAVGLLLGAFRGINFPVLGGLLVLAGAALAASLAFGLAEHLQGLNGGNAVLAAKAVIALAAAAAGGTGLIRILRHYRALKKA